MKRFINSILMVCLLGGMAWGQDKAPSAAQPAAPSVKEITAQLQTWDKKLAYLDAGFKQTTSYDGVLISASNGKLYYSQTPRLLRLDTLGADGEVAQSAVTDKKIIVMLDEKGQPVTTLNWKQWQEGQPNKALFDFGNYTALINRHDTVLFKQTPDAVILQLTPKTGEDYRLFLTLDKQDYFPQVITIEADLMRTEAELIRPVKNKKLAASLFKGVTK